MGKVGYPIASTEREARAAGTYLPISTKNSFLVCRRINGLSVEQAKRYLNALLEERTNINGRFYPTAVGYILDVLESAEKNAETKGLGKLRIRTITAEYGPSRIRRKRKGGRKMKLTHVKVVLEETARPIEKPKKEAVPEKTERKPTETAEQKAEQKAEIEKKESEGPKAEKKVPKQKGEVK